MKMDFVDNSDKFKQALENKIPAILEAVGIHLEGESKDELENTPRRVDTGNLKNSISHAVDESEPAVYIGTSIEYAIFVRWSTREPSAWHRTDSSKMPWSGTKRKYANTSRIT